MFRWAISLSLGCLVAASTIDALAAPPSEKEMAARIDARLAARWSAENVSPADLASDAVFLRRAWLDLCGTIPPINDDDGLTGIRDFLNDTGPDKRERLIKQLLEKPTHAAHFANI